MGPLRQHVTNVGGQLLHISLDMQVRRVRTQFPLMLPGVPTRTEHVPCHHVLSLELEKCFHVWDLPLRTSF